MDYALSPWSVCFKEDGRVNVIAIAQQVMEGGCQQQEGVRSLSASFVSPIDRDMVRTNFLVARIHNIHPVTSLSGFGVLGRKFLVLGHTVVPKLLRKRIFKQGTGEQYTH